jgi:hypothetical protein
LIIGSALATSDGQRQSLRTVVVEHEFADLVGHLCEHVVALLHSERALCHRGAERDLDVHLVVAAVDAGGVVDGVGVDQPARQRVFHAAALGEAEVATLPHHLAPQFSTVHPQRIIGAVAHFGVRLGGGFHVRADAAVPQHVHRCAQDDGDQIGRSARPRLGAEPASGRVAELDGLQRSRVHAAAGRQQRCLVVGPAAAWQLNSRCRSANDAAGSGSGSMKMWRWSNAATSCTCGDRNNPLPNTSPLMSPMPTTVSPSRSTSFPMAAAWRRTLSHAPRAVMPIALWS